MTCIEALEIINQYCNDNNITGKEGAALNFAMHILDRVTSTSDGAIKDYKEDYIKATKEVSTLKNENTDLKNLVVELSKKLVRSDIL